MVRSTVFAACVLGSALCAAQIATADEPTGSQPARVTAPRTCAHDTGSNIKLRSTDCSTAPSRSYTHQEIDQTGKTNIAGALRVLDPSVTTR
jgi:hypothetical protein